MVELRQVRLTNKVDMSETRLQGATISLYQGSKVITQIQSDANGDFTLDVPANGDFVMVVSYKDCNSKKFSILYRLI